ncbi:DUF58 domain-containing protein [Streptomyces sp. CA-135486]|uniref:DUF58 domain-containing protein n=1 Tax=Streptomyces sp. CA-135486 TaxID=3240049 RepID=UPI003D92A0F4
MITRTGIAVLITSGLLLVASALLASPALALPAAAGFLALGAGRAGVARRVRLGATVRVRTRSVVRGQNVGLTIGIEREGRLPLFAELHLISQNPDRPAESHVLPRPAAGSITLTAELSVHRRGVFRAGPLIVRQQDPLGLFRKDTRVADGRTVQVNPALVSVAVRAASRTATATGTGRRATPTLAGDFFALREYTPGDDPRHIHWLSSVRTGQLLIRRSSEPALPSLHVLLDLDASAYDGEESFEHAVDLTASLLVGALRAGAAGHLWQREAGARLRRVEHTGVPQVLTALSRVRPRTDPDGGSGDVATATRAEAGRACVLSKDSCFTVVTGAARPAPPALPRHLLGPGSRVVVIRLSPHGAGRYPAGPPAGRASVHQAADAVHAAALWATAAQRASRGGRP